MELSEHVAAPATGEENEVDARVPSDDVVVHVAKRIITMEPSFPDATAVAVRGSRILAVGSLDDVRAALGDLPHVIDDRFADKVVLPGLIDQHLHPVLGALTLSSVVIAPEDWDLPEVTYPAAPTEHDYRMRLREAEARMADPDEWLYSWGYHPLWHGPLDRTVLDGISTTRPVLVWHRSCHEFFLNTAAIEALDLDEASMQGKGDASDAMDFARGHWWEKGMIQLLMPHLGPVFLTPERMAGGLRQLVAYLHRSGVTAFNEPGALATPEIFQLYQAVLGADDTPFSSSFVVDGRAQADVGMAPADALADTERQIAMSPTGKVSYFADQVKLFADGAIISQRMMMREPYLTAAGDPDPDHDGDWMMTPDELEEWAKLYWDAGYQLHVHVNGDRGLDVVLDVFERRMRENPRADHRSVIVHFANSTEDQIDRIARLGALVSANPYYTTAFADRYGEVGLGPERADLMVRSASVRRRHIPLSFHSDLPMGPARPLNMVWCAVNRTTPSGRVAGPEQRIGLDDALRAVTIESAYSWRREHELGSIAAGKVASFTVLDEDPYEVDPDRLRDITIAGTVFEGRWFPLAPHTAGATARARSPLTVAGRTTGGPGGDHDAPTGCSCTVARSFTALLQTTLAAA